METTEKQKHRNIRYLLMPLQLLALSVFCIYMAFLAYTTPYSIDDFRYITYPQDGIKQYFLNNVHHYLVLNGRTYVHWLLELDLFIGRWVFPVVAVALMILIPFLFWKTYRLTGPPEQGKVTGVTGEGLLSFLVLFSGLFLAMPPFMKTDGVLWQSGFFNYILPMPVLLWMLLLLVRMEQQNLDLTPLRQAGVFLVSFLAGASTEQYGCVVVCISVCFLVRWLILHRQLTVYGLFSAAGSMIGFLVTVMAPSMKDRMYRENVFSDTAGNMMSVFSSQAKLFTMHFWNLLLLSAVIVFICIFYLTGNKEWILVGFNAVFLLISWITYLVGDTFITYIFMMATLIVTGVRLIFSRRIRMLVIGILLSSGFLSAMMVLPSQSFGSRLIVPMYLFLSLALVACMAGWPRASCGLQAGLFVGCTLLMGVTCPHYIHNYRVEMRNESYLKELPQTHELWYDVDYDRGYTRDKIDRGSIYLNGYLKRAGFNPETDQLYIYSREYPGIMYQGKRVGWYAREIDGVWCLPVRYLIETAGGTVSWNSNDFSLDIELNGVSFRYADEKLQWNDAEGDHELFVRDTNTEYEIAYFPQKICEKAFGLKTELTYDLPEGK